MKAKFCYFLLTCSDSEKETIARKLLEKGLIACAKFIPVESMYLWKGNIERDGEILILMESVEDNFEAVNAVIKKMHSYETFVLQMIPAKNINTDAQNWMLDELFRDKSTNL